MSKKIQVTLTGNESKRLIGKAAVIAPEVRSRLKQGHRLLLIGGTTVSAMSEEMGYGPMRISGRIDAGGTRTALAKGPAPHNLLIQEGTAVNADRDINGIVSQLNGSDLIVVGANAIDPKGRAALAFAAVGGGSRGYALHCAYTREIPMIVLCGLNKLIPDLGAAMAYASQPDADRSMGASIGLYHIFAPILTEVRAFDLLYNVQAVTIAGSGIGNGEGSRTFLLMGEEENVSRAWEGVLALKGAQISGDRNSLVVCHGGSEGCARHTGCMYKEQALAGTSSTEP